MTAVVNVPGDNPKAQLDELARHHPELFSAVDPDLIEAWCDELAVMGTGTPDDFGPAGRGHEYRRAQALNIGARGTGIRQLAKLALRQGTASPGHGPVLVDLLGGDGLVRRVCGPAEVGSTSILTCDLSPYMVAAAWSLGAPALIQRAERPVLKSGSVDAVLLAYGSHHIPPQARQELACQAHRILRPGGTFVLHDFLSGSATERWFSEIVDPYSTTGHKFRHFTREEIVGYMTRAGFESAELLDLDDSYASAASTAEAAATDMGRYLVAMYGLTKAERCWGAEGAWAWALARARAIFIYQEDGGTPGESQISYDESSRLWRMTIPRRAIVGVGRKAEL